MSGVRLLVGTKKGAFTLTSDGTRDEWEVNGPLFAGWEIYHVKGSPADPNRIYASQSSGWFGQVVQQRRHRVLLARRGEPAREPVHQRRPEGHHLQPGLHQRA